MRNGYGYGKNGGRKLQRHPATKDEYKEYMMHGEFNTRSLGEHGLIALISTHQVTVKFSWKTLHLVS